MTPGDPGLNSPGAKMLHERGLKASAYSRAMGTRLRRFHEGTVELDLHPDLTQHHVQAHGAVLHVGKRQVIVRADVFATQNGHDTHVAAALATCVPVGESRV